MDKKPKTIFIILIAGIVLAFVYFSSPKAFQSIPGWSGFVDIIKWIIIVGIILIVALIVALYFWYSNRSYSGRMGGE